MKYTANKSLGQHFIADSNIHKKIVKFAGCIGNKTIIEIGPGPGGLSEAILAENPKKLILIEKDEKFSENLACLNAELIIGDATKIDLREINTEKVKIIANLPYNIATNLILNWLEYCSFFESITVLIQKEVADKFLAENSRIGHLAKAFCAVDFHVTWGPKIFTPCPKVHSTLISFIPFKNQPSINFKKFSKLLKIIFSEPRKTLFNNLKVYFPQELISKIPINLTLRAENLNVKDLNLLYESLFL